jgi:hypothetical protein
MGFDLTTHYSAGVDDTTRLRHQVKICNCKVCFGQWLESTWLQKWALCSFPCRAGWPDELKISPNMQPKPFLSKLLFDFNRGKSRQKLGYLCNFQRNYPKQTLFQLPKNLPIWGRCYDHNFLRKNLAFFSKTNIMITFFAKTNSSLSKKMSIFLLNVSAKIFKKS